MSRSEMQQAQQLIKQGRYNEASRILRKIDSPTAREWLAKLDKKAPARKSRRRTGGGILRRIGAFFSYLLTIVISAGLTIALLAGLVVATAPSRGEAIQRAAEAAEATSIAALPTATATRPPRTGVVTSGQNINVRSGPGTNTAAIASLVPGTTIEVTGESDDGDWYSIRLTDGREGWVSANLVDAEPAPTSIAQASTSDTESESGPTPTPAAVCTTEEAQAWYDAHRQVIHEMRFIIFQAENASSPDANAFLNRVREQRREFEAADYPPCLDEIRATLLVGFQALSNSFQNRLNNFANEAASELNIANNQFAAADRRLVNDIGVETTRTSCPQAEFWYAGIAADVTEYLTTIENIDLDTPPSPEIRQAIFNLQALRTRVDVAFPLCAAAANDYLETSVTAAVRLFQAIMAEESAASRQGHLAAMVSEATEFLNEMRRLGIRVT
jgi:uncharacterized protein YraI